MLLPACNKFCRWFPGIQMFQQGAAEDHGIGQGIRRQPLHLFRLLQSEAQRQRQNAGMYLRENSMLPEAEQQRLLFEGGYPVLAKVAKRKGLPYPHVNQQGEIEADADWWSTMQAAG